MADFSAGIDDSPVPSFQMDLSSKSLASDNDAKARLGMKLYESTILYHQKIWDNGNSQWVFYYKTVIDLSPQPFETSPNHSGSVDSSRHVILDVVKE